MTCYFCHFESYVEGGYQDRVFTQHDGFIMLVNRKNVTVHPATYQTIVWKGNVPDATHDFKDYVEPLTREQVEKLKTPYSE